MTRQDRVGLVRPALDAHNLGITTVAQLLGDCGYEAVVADAEVCRGFEQPDNLEAWLAAERWLEENRITALGFSYRLDPAQGEELFGRVLCRLKERHLLRDSGGRIRQIYFAGLPETCARVRQRHREVAAVFQGDESPAETLAKLGISPALLPREATQGLAYDEARLAFGRELVRKAEYFAVAPGDRAGYVGYGSASDSLAARLEHAVSHQQTPLVRAHVGPFLPDRAEAVRLFLDWVKTLAGSGYLDVLSIGTSQLTQSAFGENWTGRANGGGVPLASKEEFAAVWEAARPMLVRTYAGTKDLEALARMYERTIHIAWHALSLWWFCGIDGRGPYSVQENLHHQLATLRYVAHTGKPYEPNVSHHFAFRGADDVTYIVAAVLAARLAKRCGITLLVLQVMLNTPKYTWGIQDLAKARGLLQLVRELEGKDFRVILQTRGGLDYFSPDPEKAKAQLAAVTALADDIEPENPQSPPVMHVVSYSEASHLADPATILESIKITRHALAAYRRLRARGLIDDLTNSPEVRSRTENLVAEARTVLAAVESCVTAPYTAQGLYEVFARGFLPVPYLWEGRDEFRAAVDWQTWSVRGGVAVVDENGAVIPAAERLRRMAVGQVERGER